MWLNQKRPSEIIRLVKRSHKWFYKWLNRFRQFGWPGLREQSRKPQTVSSQSSPALRQLVLRLRKKAERRGVGLIGAQALQDEIRRERLAPHIPSRATINRWLREEGLLASPAAAEKKVYYPACHLPPGYVRQAMDWISRDLPGGKEKVFAFHTLDFGTRALAQTLSRDKSGESLHRHALEVWQSIGIPDILQMDNDGAFNGGGRTPRRFGAFIRLCLWLGIEPLFTPPGEPDRNGEIEQLNGLWVRSFWKRSRFKSWSDVWRKRTRFTTWYGEKYHPPALGGRTVAQAGRGQKRTRLTTKQVAALPKGKLPITAGRVHFMRRVSASGEIKLLNETWKVSRSLRRQYVWATITTDQQRLDIYHRHSERSAARLVKTYAYPLSEKVSRLSGEYRRHARRPAVLPML